MIDSKDNETINSIISSFTLKNESLLNQINQMMYYFRGSLNRDDAWALSFIERESIITFINERFKEAAILNKNNISVFI